MTGQPALSDRNARVVSAIKLQRAPRRRESGLFLAEGANAVAAALDTNRAVELLCTEFAAAREPELIASAVAAELPVHLVSAKAARALSDAVTPPGLVAVCQVTEIPLPELLSARPTLLAVPVGIAEPGNAGTLIRVADAVGAAGVVFAGDTVDPYNGKCVRASAGSVFHLPLVRSRDAVLAVENIAAQGITVLATAADGELSLDDADELLAGPSAWLFGNEAHGLDPSIAAMAAHRVRIPIRGRAESLNLAAAAAICLYASSRAQH